MARYQYTKDGRFRTGALDKYTGEMMVQRKVTTWLDGSPLTPAKADGILYWRDSPTQGGGYWQRVLTNNRINLDWYGVVADNFTDNSNILSYCLEYFPIGYGYRLDLSNGNYLLAQTVKLKDRRVLIEGAGATVLTSPAGVSPLLFTRTTGTMFAELRHVKVRANATDFTDGNNGTSTSPFDYKVCGITTESITHFTQVEVEGYGHNWKFQGSVEKKPAAAPLGTDSSSSALYSCRSAAAYCNGFWVRGDDPNDPNQITSGDDANVINFYNCVARNSGGVGFDDGSFLGNFFFACQGDSNRGGHYRTRNFNNRSVFIGCYGESGNNPGNGDPNGNAPSIFTGRTTVVGGLHANGIVTDSQFSGSLVGNLNP